MRNKITIVYSDSKELYWKRIQLISFILAVFIIIRHNSSVYNYNSSLCLTLYDCLKYSITEVAVPLFFLISGFNFFNNFSISDQKRKFTNRIKSLLVPYLVWNSIYCIFCTIISNDFFSRFFIGRERFEVTPWNIIWGILFHNNCNSQFWFIFELMVCVLLNPLIYYVIRKKSLGVFFLLALYVSIMFFGLKLPEYFFYRTDSFLYYYFGAFLGLHFNKFFFADVKSRTIQPRRSSSGRFIRIDEMQLFAGLVCVLASMFLLIPNLHSGIRFFVIIISSFGLWSLSICCKYFKLRWVPLGGVTFLMYAAHGIIQPIVVKLLYLVLPKFAWMAVINFFLAIVITVLACMGLRFVTKRYFPFVDKLITGWRR